MIKTTVKIYGMSCGMCEAHINETIWKKYPKARSVTASHRKGEVSFLTEEAPDENELRDAINATGYTFVACESAPYEKRGLFGRK